MSAINLRTTSIPGIPEDVSTIIMSYNTFAELMALASSSTHLRKTAISKAYQIRPAAIKQFIDSLIAGLDEDKYIIQIDRLAKVLTCVEIHLHGSSNFSVLKSHYFNTKEAIINVLETVETSDLKRLLEIPPPELFENTVEIIIDLFSIQTAIAEGDFIVLQSFALSLLIYYNGFERAMHVASLIRDPECRASCFEAMSSQLCNQMKFDKAKECANKMLQIVDNFSMQEAQKFSFLKLGLSKFICAKDFDNAAQMIPLFSESFIEYTTADPENGIIFEALFFNLIRTQKFERIIETLQSISMRSEIFQFWFFGILIKAFDNFKNPNDQVMALTHLSSHLIRVGEVDKAEKVAELAREKGRQPPHPQEQDEEKS